MDAFKASILREEATAGRRNVKRRRLFNDMLRATSDQSSLRGGMRVFRRLVPLMVVDMTPGEMDVVDKVGFEVPGLADLVEADEDDVSMALNKLSYTHDAEKVRVTDGKKTEVLDAEEVEGVIENLDKWVNMNIRF